eukprot:3581840-Pyramimonas_sp.AAC.1
MTRRRMRGMSGSPLHLEAAPCQTSPTAPASSGIASSQRRSRPPPCQGEDGDAEEDKGVEGEDDAYEDEEDTADEGDEDE